MLFASVNDAIKAMQSADERGKEIEKQKEKSQTLSVNLGAENEFKGKKGF